MKLIREKIILNNLASLSVQFSSYLRIFLNLDISKRATWEGKI